jgi:hypothetical protein
MFPVFSPVRKCRSWDRKDNATSSENAIDWGSHAPVEVDEVTVAEVVEDSTIIEEWQQPKLHSQRKPVILPARVVFHSLSRKMERKIPAPTKAREMDPPLALAHTTTDGHVSHWPRYGAALDEFIKHRPLIVLGPTMIRHLVHLHEMKWIPWRIPHVPGRTGR